MDKNSEKIKSLEEKINIILKVLRGQLEISNMNFKKSENIRKLKPKHWDEIEKARINYMKTINTEINKALGEKDDKI